MHFDLGTVMAQAAFGLVTGLGGEKLLKDITLATGDLRWSTLLIPDIIVPIAIGIAYPELIPLVIAHEFSLVYGVLSERPPNNPKNFRK